MAVTGNRGEFGVQSVNCETMAQEAEEKKQMEDSESSPQMSEMTNAESDVTSGEEESTTGATEGTSNLRRRTSRFKSVDSRNLLDEIPVGKKQEDNNSSSAARVEVASNAKFTLRPSSPAHRKIKESPLSSDAIFHQASWKIDVTSFPPDFKSLQPSMHCIPCVRMFSFYSSFKCKSKNQGL